LAFVVVYPSCEAGGKLRSGLEGVDLNEFVYEAASPTIHEHIVHPTPSIIQRDPDVVALQHLGELERRDFAALVGVGPKAAATR